MPTFSLPFAPNEVRHYASFYRDIEKDKKPMDDGSAGRVRGFLTRDEFLRIAAWKSPRPKRWHEMNTAAEVEHASRSAFSSANEVERILALDELKGVAWRTATAILHVVFPDRYPLADVNAFATLGAVVPSEFNLAIWLEYCDFCRKAAKNAGVDLRTLDRALWSHYDRQKKLLRDQGACNAHRVP